MSAGKTPSGTAPADFQIPEAARERFSMARAAIQLYWPFLTSAAYRLVPRWTPLVPTLAVDRYWRLYMNPEFVMKHQPPELALLIAGHELQHALLHHDVRLSEHRDKMIILNGNPISFSNACHDLAINSSLGTFAESGVKYRKEVSGKPGSITAPKDCLYPENVLDKNGKALPNGLVSEAYAQLLIDNSTQLKCKVAGGAGSGSCGSGGGQDPQPWEDRGDPNPDDPDSGVSSEEQDILRQHTAEAAREQAAKHRGTVPGAMELWAEAHLTPPKVDWRKELRAAVRKGVNWAKGRVDYSFHRPNRRTIATMSRIVLPGMFAPEPRIVVGFDTSGSMGSKDYDLVFSEIRGILQTCGMPKVPVLACDARAYGVQYISDVREIEMTGGGGTDMDAAIEACLQVKGVSLVIICTDGITSWSPEPPPGNVKVIIVLTQPESEHWPAPDWARIVAAYEA